MQLYARSLAVSCGLFDRRAAAHGTPLLRLFCSGCRRPMRGPIPSGISKRPLGRSPRSSLWRSPPISFTPRTPGKVEDRESERRRRCPVEVVGGAAVCRSFRPGSMPPPAQRALPGGGDRSPGGPHYRKWWRTGRRRERGRGRDHAGDRAKMLGCQRSLKTDRFSTPVGDSAGTRCSFGLD